MQKNKPNILFFFTDDQRFDTIAALGNKHIKTPNIDRLVGEGTAFTRAYIPGGTCGAVCMPSRAMLHTGKTLFHLEDSGTEIPDDHTLLGETLQQAQYRTFGTGKWHNGTKAYARSFTDGGEIFFGGMGDHWNVPAYNFDPTGKYDKRSLQCPDYFYSKNTLELICDHTTPGKHSSELFCEKAVDFIKNYDSDDLFFMYVSFMAPHDPRVMPDEYRAMYDEDSLPLPDNFMQEHPFDKGEMCVRDEMLAPLPRTPQMVREHLADYYAMITHLDSQIGIVLKQLEQSGEYDNTIIILAGDNGLALGQHGLFGKQNCYEHSLRVPLIFSGPGIAKGQKVDDLCYLLDIYPTICDMLEIEIPKSVEGQSLLPSIEGSGNSGRKSLYLAYTQDIRGVRTEKYKLIEYMVDGKNTTQLFDLEQDPFEINNIVSKPELSTVVEQMQKELRRLSLEWNDIDTKWGRDFWRF